MHDLMTDTEIVNLSPVLGKSGYDLIADKCFQYGVNGIITVPLHLSYLRKQVKNTLWLDTYLASYPESIILSIIKACHLASQISNYCIPIHLGDKPHIYDSVTQYAKENKINIRYRIDPRYVNNDALEQLCYQMAEANINSVILGSRRQSNFNIYKVLACGEHLKKCSDIKFSIMGKLIKEDIDLIYQVNDPKIVSLCLTLSNFADLLEN